MEKHKILFKMEGFGFLFYRLLQNREILFLFDALKTSEHYKVWYRGSWICGGNLISHID